MAAQEIASRLKSDPEFAPVLSPQRYRVLVACNLSDLSEGVLREAIDIAQGHVPAELHLVTVLEKHQDHYILSFEEQRRHLSLEVVESLMNKLVGKVRGDTNNLLEGAMKQTVFHVCTGEPAAEILRLSREIGADVIVVGSRERQGPQSRVWGSVSKTVMAHADCSVILARPFDLVHGVRTPPTTWRSEGYQLQMHHYHL